MKVRKHLYNKAKRSNSQSDWEAYRKIKNSINTTLKKAHNVYYSRLFDSSFNGKRRQFWKYIRAKRQNKHDIPTLFINVTGFVKIDPNHTGTEIYFITEH